MQGRIRTHHITSTAVARGCFGLPSQRQLCVYEPPGYTEANALPCVVLLPAFGRGHGECFFGQPWKPSPIERLDALIASDAVPPVLACAVDTWTPFGGSQFVDSPIFGDFQQLLADELPAFLRKHWNVRPGAGALALMGASSGGFGVLRMLLDRPGVYAVAAAHAPDGAFDMSLRPLLLRAAQAVRRAGNLETLARRIAARGPEDQLAFEAAIVLACLAAYTSTPSAAWPHFEMPCSLETGQVNEAAWREICSADPLRRLADRGGDVADVKFLYLDAGTEDEFGLNYATEAFYRAMGHGPEVVFEPFAGGHRGLSARYAHSLPLVAQRLWDSGS